MQNLTTWDASSGTSLRKTVTFADFKEALRFVNEVGKIAEELNHHPDICIKDYNDVSMSLTTHHEGSVVTKADHALAERIDAVLSSGGFKVKK
jgi:4a-hydroxytetrahydrobiopterin dehydratase